MLRALSVTQWLFAGMIGCGLLFGLATRGPASLAGIYALCLLSAIVIAAAQQTLP